MTNRATRAGAYFRKIRQQSRDYIEQLLKENERLRLLQQACQARHEQCEEETEARGDLQAREAEQEDRLLRDQYIELEQQNSNLAGLYVASCRLHSTLDRAEVLNAIEEIVTNLIGSEELAIFEMTEDGLALCLMACRGVESARYRTVPVGRGRIGQAAQTGELFVAEPGGPPAAVPEERNLSACIPLVLDERVIGEIAIFRLLSQKQAFNDFDQELFELLGRHAASALYCTRLYERQTRVTA